MVAESACASCDLPRPQLLSPKACAHVVLVACVQLCVCTRLHFGHTAGPRKDGGPPICPIFSAFGHFLLWRGGPRPGLVVGPPKLVPAGAGVEAEGCAVPLQGTVGGGKTHTDSGLGTTPCGGRCGCPAGRIGRRGPEDPQDHRPCFGIFVQGP